MSDKTKRKLSEKNKGKVLSDDTKKKVSEAKSTGGLGHKKIRNDGYVYIYFPDHPRSSKDGYIMEHVLVMECLIGRHLDDEEVVHHINHRRNDNRKDNLQLMTVKEHMSMHTKERHNNNEIPHYGKTVVNLDTGETFKSAADAAKKYGVSRGNISRACRKANGTSVGYRWSYSD